MKYIYIYNQTNNLQLRIGTAIFLVENGDVKKTVFINWSVTDTLHFLETAKGMQVIRASNELQKTF